MSKKEDKIIKSFTVHIPVELVKSENSDNNEESEESWIIQGIASTDDKDLQGEEVLQDGLDISTLKAGRGLFNNDHKNNPEDILGQIEEANFIDHNGKKALFVKGYLFKYQPRAQAYYNIMRSIKKGSPSRVHYSIEGKVLERDMINSGRIRKARIDKVALTLDPVNPCTFAELAKSLAAQNKEIETNETLDFIEKIVHKVLVKALAAGAGYSKAPAARAGGEAMSSESLDRKVKKMTAKKMKKLKKSQSFMLKSLVEKVIELYKDENPLEIAEMICKSYELKLKELHNVD